MKRFYISSETLSQMAVIWSQRIWESVNERLDRRWANVERNCADFGGCWARRRICC